jgi:putative hydrolase of the HAD superfamily
MDIPVDSKTAVVFDLDDTLYNEIDFLKSAYVSLSKKLEPEAWQALFSNLFSRYRSKTNVFQFVSETYGIPINELIEAYRNHVPVITPFDGVIDVMNHIKEKDGKIGMNTDGRSATQRNKLKALGVYNYLDVIIISEEIGSEKPSEQNYRLIEKELGCTTNYYLADNFKKDFVTPNNIGWKTIGLLDNGLNIHSNAFEYQDEAHLPHVFISSISELVVK